MRHPVIRILFLLLAVLVIGYAPAGAQIKIGIIRDHLDKQELGSIRTMFQNDKAISFQEISLKELSSPGALEKFPQIWYHRTDTSSFDAAELALAKQVQQYVRNGGHLFLSMEAVPLLNKWGIESNTIELDTDTLIDEGFGRPAGFHAFKSHPMFSGLSGGVYTSKQKKDHIVRKHGFFGDAVPKEGKVAGIQWTYITFTEENKLLLEYVSGKGSVIAAGAYLYYAADNYNREHLKKFTDNVFLYQEGKLKGQERHYWSYAPASIRPGSFAVTPVKRLPASKWDIPAPSLQLSQKNAGKSFYDLVGRRILWMGKMNAGMDEIWIHPYMALRDLQMGVKVKGTDSISWLNNIPATVTVTPEYLEREYSIRNSVVREIYTVSFEHPAGVAHLEIKGDDLMELSVKYASSLRYMWPYSHHATGSIAYAFDRGINGHIISGQNGSLNTVVLYSEIPINRSASTDTSLNQVKVKAAFALHNGSAINLSIIGSEKSPQDAVNIYLRNQSDMNRLFLASNHYYRSLLDNHLYFITPDTAFNNGYRWALARTDQFLQTTPNIGTALMAGFGTTARGWNGRQKISGRPGYAWYFGRDGEWSAMAIDAYGDFGMVKEALETFIRFQDINGKIYHELTSSGAVHYDASDATPLFVILAAHYLRYSGDAAFIKKNWPAIKKAMDFCYSTDTDHDGLIENTNVGHGWIEGGSLFGTHTEYYLAGCWAAALDAAAYMGRHIGIKDVSGYNSDAASVRQIIDTDFWNKSEQFFNNGKMIDGSFMPDATVLAAVPIYLDAVSDSLKASAVTKRFTPGAFSTDWGIRMIEETNKKFRPGSYHAGMVWPLYGGWASLAEFRMGNFKSGFRHIMNNLLVYRHWGLGSIEETLNGNIYEPNGVCSHQCWSETMVLQPAIEGMLGYRPDAMANKIELAPAFPWDWKFCTVRNIRMNKTLIDLDMKKEPGQANWKIQSNKNVDISFHPAFPVAAKITKVTVNGKKMPVVISKQPDGIRLILDFAAIAGNNQVVVETEGGIGALPAVPLPNPGDSSAGVKIVSEKVDGKTYSLLAEGRPGKSYEIKIYSAKQITKISNARIVKRENDIVTILLEMPGAGTAYVRKEIKIEM